ncbi:type VI secretion system tube protein TssD [Glacieibacterium frigidum]|uniref:Type VI secretion system tube protein Hcp n=1 Tax=Glacieibacterium frigidum TaxID=2593303 RepID=A0A552UAI1_9SPHN|nr:type VI secretion system tube protein TssD [Glacieibacterium frigidum]TRW15230.1 type VI secretion system tube protein Hcp [Glacieibacterium frigidum]
MPTYLKLTGTKQGWIKGGSIQKGREGQIEVHSLDHGIARPDPAALVATGRLGHGAFRVTKRIDKASPPLYAALVGNELMSDCLVNFWLPNPKGSASGGAEVLAYTIRLSDAVVTAIALTLADAAAPDADKRIATETISLAYKSIEWTWTDGNIIANATR